MNKNAFFGLLTILLVFGLIGCDNGNGDEEVFVASTNETISNDINTLGLIGTSVSSSNENVATVVIVSGKIKITSVGNGSVIITVTESSKNATINITVAKTGLITIGTITKYVEINNEGLNLSGTIWECKDHSNTWPSPEPLNGGLKFLFIDNTNWKQTGIIANTTEFANGTYIVTNDTVTITTINYWNGSIAVPQVMEWQATVSNNVMAIGFGGQIYNFIKK